MKKNSKETKDLGVFFPYNMNLKERAREMRKNPTNAEKKLWNILRTGELKQCRFLRQKILGNYIADFYCSKHQLIIEADGGGHQELEQKEYDTLRTMFFEELGIFVIRFWNNDILGNPNGVYEEILSFLEKSPPPLFSRGETRRILVLKISLFPP